VKLGRHSRTALETAKGPQNFVNFGELTAKSRTVIFYTRPQLMAGWKAHSRLTIRVDLTFSLSIGVRELRGEMFAAWLFSQVSRLLQSNFIWTLSSPSTILGIRKLHCVSKKFPALSCLKVGTFFRHSVIKLSVTLSNLNRCSKILHC